MPQAFWNTILKMEKPFPALGSASAFNHFIFFFQVQPKYLYKLLCSLNTSSYDILHVMELVKMKKPITALDFCYQGEPESISVLECISLCVLVIAYDSGTMRARQMLAILEAIMPYFLRDLQRDKKNDPKTCRETIVQLTLSMKALLNNCDELTK